ncbi:MAG: hypothetical protein JOZ58_05355 [Acetobacteraceae bacterium]|nr:hypothetical protein [Acetobacteraceae bacterium]
MKAAALAYRLRHVLRNKFVDNSFMESGLQDLRCDSPVEARRSFLDYSASRVGQTWTDEDHIALLRHLAQVDELCIAIWQQLAAQLESQH